MANFVVILIFDLLNTQINCLACVFKLACMCKTDLVLIVCFQASLLLGSHSQPSLKDSVKRPEWA